MAEPALVGVVQMRAVPGQPEQNLATAGAHVARLAGQGARVIVLPELFASGYDLDMDLPAASDADGSHTNTLIAWARKYGLVLATALLTRTADGELLDLAMIVGPEGVMASASKRFLWGRERLSFTRRIEPGALAQTPWGTVGVAICYEAGFPEVARGLAMRGADIIAIPAAFGRSRLYAWELLTRSRALENGCFVAAAGLTGPAFAANSRIVSPTGDILAGLGWSEGTVLAPADMADIDRSRAEIPYLTDLVADAASQDEGEQACLTSTS